MQNTTKKSNSHIYDYVVVGAGLTGLCVANALSRVSTNILLVDSAESFGGHNRSVNTAAGIMNNGLRYLPETDLAHKSIAFLETLLMTHLKPESLDLPAVTYTAGGIKPFVGFGDQSPSFYDEISYFTGPRSIHTVLDVHEWTQVLFSHFSGEFLPRSYVTKFHAENGRVTGLTINGQKQIFAQNVIYAGPVRRLVQLLPEGALSSKAIQKLSKGPYWTAVCLDLLHSQPVTDSKAVHILNGTTADDLGPCAGRFFATENAAYSQWLTFVSDDEAEDSEVIANALKKIKRQIKRAYPTALDQLAYERILVVPSQGGHGELKLSGQQTIPGLENFFVASGTVHQQKNILGSLLQAELVTSALGCHPLGTQVNIETSLDTPSQDQALEESHT